MLILAGVPYAEATVIDFGTPIPSGSIQNRNGEVCPSTLSVGWSTGGGGGSKSPFAFTCNANGGTPSPGTGPSAGVGGSGAYLVVEANAPRAPGNYFTLTYNGSACPDSGEGVSSVTFLYYHMYFTAPTWASFS